MNRTPARAGIAHYDPQPTNLSTTPAAHGRGSTHVAGLPAQPEPGPSRPNTAPAYFLGHPARLWLTVMRAQ